MCFKALLLKSFYLSKIPGGIFKCSKALLKYFVVLASLQCVLYPVKMSRGAGFAKHIVELKKIPNTGNAEFLDLCV